MYRVNVQLAHQSIKAYGEDIALKPGLTLQADVLQERRKVWEWVLEPVLAARQQVLLPTEKGTPQGTLMKKKFDEKLLSSSSFQGKSQLTFMAKRSNHPI